MKKAKKKFLKQLVTSVNHPQPAYYTQQPYPNPYYHTAQTQYYQSQPYQQQAVYAQPSPPLPQAAVPTAEQSPNVLFQLLYNNDSNLTKLDLFKQAIDSAQAKELALALANNTKLTQLNFKKVKLEAEGAKAIFQALQKNSTLAKLKLSHHPMSMDELKAVAALLVTNSALTKLSLKHNKIGAEGVKILADALLKNQSITELDLSKNNIGFKGAKDIASLLEKNTSLKGLQLAHNNLGNEGGKAIASGLVKNNALAWLDLRHNNISSDTAKNLAIVLQKNAALQMLNLAHNQIGIEGLKALAQALQMNTSLIQLELAENPIGDESRQILATIDGYLKRNASALQAKSEPIVTILPPVVDTTHPQIAFLQAELDKLQLNYQSAQQKLQALEQERLALAAEKNQSETRQISNPSVLFAGSQQNTSDLLEKLQTLEAENKELNSLLLPEIPSSSITISRTLGKGSYGVVQLGQWKGKAVAVKKLMSEHHGDDKEIRRFKREARLLGRLRSPYIVMLYGVNFAQGYQIIMEYLPKGSLRQLIEATASHHQHFTLNQMRDMALQIAYGLEYLHQLDILHLDLKPENILIADDNQLKLADFGVSLKLEDSQGTLAEMKGTLEYLAPEIFDDGKKAFQKKADIYSYGIILWELASCEIPYAKQNIIPAHDRNSPATAVRFHKHVTKSKNRPEPAPEALLPKEGHSLARLIKSCWTQQPNDRPTADEVVQLLEQPDALMSPPTQHQPATPGLPSMSVMPS